MMREHAFEIVGSVSKMWLRGIDPSPSRKFLMVKSGKNCENRGKNVKTGKIGFRGSREINPC